MVEVMVGLGIVAILAMMTIPLASRVKGLRDDIVCSSNLRQIGMGILAYTQDFGGVLPGPLNSSQFPYKDRNSQLSHLLVDYLAVNDRAKKTGRPDVFMCPAFRKVVKKVDQSPVFRINVEVPMGPDLKKCAPFGYLNSEYPALYGTSIDFPPMRLAELSEIRDQEGRPARTTTWMMKDIDYEDLIMQQHVMEFTPYLPPSRVHGDHRNAIFFDFHMEKIDWIKK